MRYDALRISAACDRYLHTPPPPLPPPLKRRPQQRAEATDGKQRSRFHVLSNKIDADTKAETVDVAWCDALFDAREQVPLDRQAVREALGCCVSDVWLQEHMVAAAALHDAKKDFFAAQKEAKRKRRVASVGKDAFED